MKTLVIPAAIPSALSFLLCAGCTAMPTRSQTGSHPGEGKEVGPLAGAQPSFPSPKGIVGAFASPEYTGCFALEDGEVGFRFVIELDGSVSKTEVSSSSASSAATRCLRKLVERTQFPLPYSTRAVPVHLNFVSEVGATYPWVVEYRASEPEESAG